MMKMEWTRMLNAAIDYIENNITEELTCEDVAEQIYLSGFHFHRTFTLLTGMTLGDYIRNRRLSLAAQELLTGRTKVIDVALKYGYQTPESFSKAFSKFHGVMPSQVKKEGTILKSFNRLNLIIKLEGGNGMAYKIVNKDAFEVVAITKMFEDETSMTEIPKFWDDYFKAGYDEKVCGCIGICYEEMNNSKRWRYGIGCEKQYAKEIPEGFETLNIPAHTWAVFTCIGAMPDAIQGMWKRIYSEWLPASNYTMLSDFDFEFYYEGDSRSSDYRSEIWIAVKEK
jgi:AraC family transcriptional regulator